LNISGGKVSDTIGYISRYVGSEGTVNLNGTGTWANSGSIYIGNSGVGTLNYSGSAATLTTGTNSTNYIASSTGSTGTANLEKGAVWYLQGLAGGEGVSTVNFDDATLKANKNRVDFVTKVTTMNLLAGGAVIDSNGFNIGITQTGFSGEGALRKISAGILTLAGQSHHTGGVTIEGGAVSANHLYALGDGTTTIQSGTALGSTVSLVSLGGIDLQNGGSLSTNGSSVGAWNLTNDFFMDGGTYQLDITATNMFDVVKGTGESGFTLLSGTINLALHSGFDYELKYYVFDGFGLGNNTRDSDVLLSGYDAVTYTGRIQNVRE
jgi:T5SS/PEP-CTERM-associated repeat protein/autotransporter-associated beta strand protein